jgi:hypothetical protein
MELPELPEDLKHLPHMAWLQAKMLKLYRSSRLTAVDLPTAATLLLNPDAPPPTQEELNHVKFLIDQEIALLNDLKTLIQRLIDKNE